MLNLIVSIIPALKNADVSNVVYAGPFGMGGGEMIVVLIIVLLLFGGKKIPELMKGLGKGVKEFKDASKGDEEKSNTATPEKKD